MMKAVFILLVITTFSQAFAYSGIRPAYCEGSTLISNLNTELYDFSFNSECNKALNESRLSRGHFCDGDRLILPDGTFFLELNWTSDCQKALIDLRSSRFGLFCDDKDMYRVSFGYLLSHKFQLDCRKAIQDAGRYQGYFCRDGQMFDFHGNYLKDYKFSSRCKEALKKITF